MTLPRDLLPGSSSTYQVFIRTDCDSKARTTNMCFRASLAVDCMDMGDIPNVVSQSMRVTMEKVLSTLMFSARVNNQTIEIAAALDKNGEDLRSVAAYISLFLKGEALCSPDGIELSCLRGITFRVRARQEGHTAGEAQCA